MRIDVDRDLCDGQGECARVAPAIFELDESTDQVIVLCPEPDESLRAVVEDAVRSCPKAALHVT